MAFRTVKVLVFLRRLKFSVPEIQKYILGTLDVRHSKKDKESEIQYAVFVTL